MLVWKTYFGTAPKLPGAAPATDHDEGSPRVVISGLNRTAFDLAVYASQGWLPTHHARLASGCWSGSTGRDWLPAGFHLKGFKLRLSSSPELLGARSDRVSGRLGPGRPGWLPTQVSGKEVTSPPPPPLRTARESFPSCSSSLSNALRRTRLSHI